MARRTKGLPIDYLTIGAAIIIVAFFLPWVKFGGSFAGYEIPDIARSVGKLTSMKAWTGKFDINVYLVYALWLVPLSAVGVFILGVMGKDVRPAAWVAAVMPLAGFVYGILRMGLDVFPRIGTGGWLTIAAATLMLLALLNLVRFPGKG